MSDEVVRLVADIDTKPIKKGMKSAERSVDSSAKEMERDLGRVEKSAKKVGTEVKKSGRSFTDAGQTGAKAAGIVGAGFAGMAGGISVATASAESFEGAMIGASASIVSGFAAGGPVGLAISAAGVGIGLLVKHIQSAGVELEEARKQVEAFAAAVLKTENSATSWLRALQQADEERERIANAMWRFEGATDAAISRVVSLETGVSNLKGSLRENTREQARLTAEIQRTADLGEDAAVENQKYVDQRARLQESERRMLRDLQTAIGLRNEATAAAGKLSGESRDAAAAAERMSANIGEWAGPIQASADAFDALAKSIWEGSAAVGEMAGPVEAVEVNVAQILDDFRKTQEAIDRGNRSLDEELQLLRAATDAERDRIRLQQERDRLLEEGLDKAKVQEKFALELAELAEREAEAKDKGAKATVTAVKAAKSAQASAAGFKDVTKGFQGIGGGMFGFGAAGPGPRSFFSPEVSANSATKTALDKAAAEAKKTKDAQKSAAEAAGKLAGEAAKMAQAAVDGATQIVQNADAAFLKIESQILTLGALVGHTDGWAGIGGA